MSERSEAKPREARSARPRAIDARRHVMCGAMTIVQGAEE